jgi:hypothetical protein
MIKLQRRLAFLAVPAVLALGVASYASVVAFSSPSPNPNGAKAAAPAEPAESTTEPAEAAEPNEPALAGGGYADKDNTQADTQQEGIN